MLARHDYFAFGEDAGPGPATGPERQRFTGKERDSETFFDYFNARYYRNVIGRFTAVDPIMNTEAATADPSSGIVTRTPDPTRCDSAIPMVAR